MKSTPAMHSAALAASTALKDRGVGNGGKAISPTADLSLHVRVILEAALALVPANPDVEERDGQEHFSAAAD